MNRISRTSCTLFPVAGMLALSSLVGACDSASNVPVEDQREVVLQGMLNATILPEFDAFRLATRSLAENADALCVGSGGEVLATTQASWKRAHESWRALETYRFGPMVDFPERLGSNIDFGPLRTEELQALLDADAAITADSLPLSGAAVRGLPATEWVLFGVDVGSGEVVLEARECEYLVAATTDLNTMATRLNERWVNDFSAEFTAPWDGEYMSPQDALAEVVNRIGFTVENTRIETLDEPVISDGNVDATLIDAPFARNAMAGISASLTTLDRLMHGDLTVEADGVDHLLRIRRRDDLVAAFDDALLACRNSIDAVGVDLETALRDSPALVEQLQDDLFTLQQVVQADIIGELGLSLSFNDSDGD